MINNFNSEWNNMVEFLGLTIEHGNGISKIEAYQKLIDLLNTQTYQTLSPVSLTLIINFINNTSHRQIQNRFKRVTNKLIQSIILELTTLRNFESILIQEENERQKQKEETLRKSQEEDKRRLEEKIEIRRREEKRKLEEKIAEQKKEVERQDILKQRLEEIKKQRELEVQQKQEELNEQKARIYESIAKNPALYIKYTLNTIYETPELLECYWNLLENENSCVSLGNRERIYQAYINKDKVKKLSTKQKDLSINQKKESFKTKLAKKIGIYL